MVGERCGVGMLSIDNSGVSSAANVSIIPSMNELGTETSQTFSEISRLLLHNHRTLFASIL